MRREPFDCPVLVYVVRRLGPRQKLFDRSSLARGNWKEIEDTLVDLGWFVDDSPKYIADVRFFQDLSRRSQGACIDVHCFEALESDLELRSFEAQSVNPKSTPATFRPTNA